MFITYVRRELRRRTRQAVLIALGIALGVGLVITVTAASAGVRTAQGTVLRSLYGIGTDITVTEPPQAGTQFDGPLMSSGQARAVPGQPFRREEFVSRSLGLISSSSVAGVSRLRGVAVAVGELGLTDLSVTGTFNGDMNSSVSSLVSNIKVKSLQVDGVDPAAGAAGPLAGVKITAGRPLRPSDARADVAMLDAGYATSAKLSVGSTFAVMGRRFTVVGIVTTPAGGSAAEAFMPLQTAQEIGQTQDASSMSGQVNTIYVRATSAARISAVAKEIAGRLPSATVTTPGNVPAEVTSSLSNSSRLVDDFGRWLAIIVLVAAFVLASLLTTGAVSRRIPEFGTLKAMGWRSRRVIGQVMTEAVVIGMIGGLVGIGAGYAGASLVSAAAPSVSASIGGSWTPEGSQFGGDVGGMFTAIGRAVNDTRTAAVPVHASVPMSSLVLAVLVAIAGGLIAGSLAGWRAARLRPAAALAWVN